MQTKLIGDSKLLLDMSVLVNSVCLLQLTGQNAVYHDKTYNNKWLHYEHHVPCVPLLCPMS